MDQFKDNFGNVQPQMVSLVIVTLIFVLIGIFIYSRVKKQTPVEAPKGTLIIVEQYIGAFDELFEGITRNRLTASSSYLFTLFSFLALSNVLSLIGFPTPTSAYSVPLLLGIVAWGGIWVVGIMYHKFAYLKKFLYNPTEILSQFAPLISISFRLFGNMIAGASLLYLVTHFLGWIWGFIPGLGQLNMLAVVFTPPLRLFFDFFDGLIQAFVFSLLTIMYWAVELPDEEYKQPIDPKELEKTAKIANKKVIVPTGAGA